ncbi:hypothetical protein DFR70_13320 [Nocardia tenerifensis]|uniref:Uncharacterized protein n=1 Tax=Nocardia tenerifensis TaxID=228006 RepID=A0A318JJZ4_9NOCA|nr:hypothetical protein [Nocardia tenerifensis]PXX52288.1 hypothetical protein DFR70_13320 [Nocardia tenerifensis]
MTNWFAGVATIVVGFWAGWVSIRVGRKLPHERLKQLAEIREELGELDTEHVIEAAIQRELRLLKQLNAAREESRRKYIAVWLSQHILEVLGGAFALVCAYLLVVLFVAMLNGSMKTASYRVLMLSGTGIMMAVILVVFSVTARMLRQPPRSPEPVPDEPDPEG